MPENDFLPFAVGSGANVESQSSWAAETTLLANGFQSGIAPSAKFNKVMRQTSIMAAVLAQFIVQETGDAVIDDGTTATILANLTAAIHAVVGGGGGGGATWGSITGVLGSQSDLQAALNALIVPNASTTVIGQTRLATTAEAAAGSAANIAVTPAGLSTALGATSVVHTDQGYNTVGSFCFAFYSVIATALASGATVAGSSLQAAIYSDAINGIKKNLGYLTGTWRNIGGSIGTSDAAAATTMFQRIA